MQDLAGLRPGKVRSNELTKEEYPMGTTIRFKRPDGLVHGGAELVIVGGLTSFR